MLGGDRRRRPLESLRGELHQPADRRRVAPGYKVEGAARPLAREPLDRVGDVVHRDDVDRRAPARRERPGFAAAKGAQRRVEHVERGCPAGAAVAYDDARPQDLERKVPEVVAQQRLGLELRALVGIAEALADVEVVLAEVALCARPRRTRSKRTRGARARRAPCSARRAPDIGRGALDVDARATRPARGRTTPTPRSGSPSGSARPADPRALRPSRGRAAPGRRPRRAADRVPAAAPPRPRRRPRARVRERFDRHVRVDGAAARVLRSRSRR